MIEANAPARRLGILPQLTSLRFLAATAIVFHHFGNETLPRHWALDRLINGLSSGVSFFFVLSGFVMVYAYHAYGDGMSRRAFYLARIARIYPVYLLGLVLMLPVAIHWFGGMGASSWIAEIFVPAAFGIALLQAWIPSIANHLNGPGWSLSAEVFFYLCFPPLLKSNVRQFLVKHPFKIVFALWVAGTIPPVVALLLWPNLSSASLQTTEYAIAGFVSFWPAMRIPEFIIGVVAGLLYVQPDRRNVPAWSAVLCMVLALAALIATPIEQQLLLHNSMFAPLFALIIYRSACSTTVATRWLSHRIPVLLGEASYAMYILHWPLKSLFSGAAKEVGMSRQAFFWTYLGATIAISIGVFLWIENPARRWLRRRLGASQG